MDYRKNNQRLKAIKLFKEGHTRKDIAQWVGVTQKTVGGWIRDEKNKSKDLAAQVAELKSQLTELAKEVTRLKKLIK